MPTGDDPAPPINEDPNRVPEDGEQPLTASRSVDSGDEGQPSDAGFATSPPGPSGDAPKPAGDAQAPPIGSPVDTTLTGLDTQLVSMDMNDAETYDPVYVGIDTFNGVNETVDIINDTLTDTSQEDFFDSEGTERTIQLEEGQNQFVAYMFLEFPRGMEIAAVQWKLDFPEGVKIINDKYLDSRMMSLGQIHKGLSERFHPCLTDQRVMIHELTFLTSTELKNAVFSILPGDDSGVLGVAECIEGYPIVKAASFKAVVNPED